MSKFTLMVVLLAAIFLQGCAETVESHEVLLVRPGTTRAEVEEILGDPVKVEETDEGRIYKYSYAIDANELDNPKLAYLGGAGAAGLLIIPFVVLQDVSGVSDQRETLFVVYGSNNEVTSAETGEQRESRLAAEREKKEREQLAAMGDPEAQYQMGSSVDYELAVRRRWLRLAAEQGHVEAMYVLGKFSEEGSNDQWHWYCQAAIRGNAEAQYELGRGYHSGNAPGGADLSKTLFWYTLSDSSGYRHGQSRRCYQDENLGWTCEITPDPSIVEVRSELTDEKIAEAERLVAEWDPNPAECESIATGVSDAP